MAVDFDARGILSATPVDQHCTYTLDGVSDAGWDSVLFRVGHRSDPAGLVDIPPGAHPRVMVTQRGTAPVHQYVGGRRRSARIAPGRSWVVPPGEPLTYEWSGAGTAVREVSILVLPRSDLDDAAAALQDRPGGRALRWDAALLADDDVVGAVMAGVRRALTAGVDDLYAQTASTFLAQMADVAGLSRYHFLRVFAAATGETPRRYLTRLRVQVACRRWRSMTSGSARCAASSTTTAATA